MPDLNLLVALDVLLEEASVARAARRLRLSASAMSRTLTRLREATGDPLLVRAGQGLVPTPRAIDLRTQVGQIVRGAETILRPAERLDIGRIARTFTLRTSDGFVENFGPELIARIRNEAPGVRLRFTSKFDRDSAALRDGTVDLETGVVGAATGPEIRVQRLFQDRFVAVVSKGHALCRGRISAARYAEGSHVAVSRRGDEHGAIDRALEALGLERNVVAVAGGFAAALALARRSDLIASVPQRHTARLRSGMHSFALPFAVPAITVSLLWHPRLHSDPAHRWLRGCVRAVCAEASERGDA